MPFYKGHPNYKKKGTKHRKTLLEQERRAIFDNLISQTWEETIENLKSKDPRFVASEFMGERPKHFIIQPILNIDEDVAKKNAVAPKPKDNSERQP